MTQEEARKMSEVMMAYAEGKRVEFKLKISSKWETWKGAGYTLGFDFNEYDYRIKKEPTYRPFKNKEECWAEMQKHQPFGWIKGKHSGIYEILSGVGNARVFRFDSGVLFKDMYNIVTFADGTPFGIKEE